MLHFKSYFFKCPLTKTDDKPLLYEWIGADSCFVGPEAYTIWGSIFFFRRKDTKLQNEGDEKFHSKQKVFSNITNVNTWQYNSKFESTTVVSKLPDNSVIFVLPILASYSLIVSVLAVILLYFLEGEEKVCSLFFSRTIDLNFSLL